MAQKQLYFTLLLIIAHQVLANEQQWKSFKEKYSKNYKDDAEELIRKKVFVENLAMIEEHNAKHEQGLVTYRKGVNEFADLAKEEFAKSRLGFRVKDGDLNRPNEVSILQTGRLPDKINWVDLGAVTGVKDQGACGSCWSFSTTGSLEGQYFVKNKKLVSLSEQNLVDCSRSYGNMGCEGGLMDNAFKYVHDNGIMSEDDYPYVAEDERCEFKINKSVLIDSSFVDIKSGSEADLQAAVANIGPISVAVDATEFQTYTDGIMKDSNCGNDKFSLNHGVLVVGYGTSEDGQDYWLVKNSWGERWGENGYIRIARNNDNQCGIATAASYPVL